jgi:hypothetical protein
MNKANDAVVSSNVRQASIRATPSCHVELERVGSMVSKLVDDIDVL